MPDNPYQSIRLLFPGALSPGSNSGSMARALARCGPIVNCVDQGNYLPIPHSRRLFVRGIYRLLHPLFLRQYNDRVAAELRLFRPDLMVVYKGESLEPRSLQLAHELGVTPYNIYPDTSAFAYGARIPRCIPLYDHVFTTKSFGVRDFQHHFNITNVTYLPHGFDPELHRPMTVSPELKRQFGADVSFIGTWSPKKESYLAAVASWNRDVSLQIWGAQWENSSTALLKPHVMGAPLVGILYPLAAQCSRIAVALLIKAIKGAPSGDQTTARTFELPATGAFMLHERTAELTEFFQEGKEVACFGTPQELAEKVSFYLKHEAERERIRLAGYHRCVAENSMDARASRLLEHFLSTRKSNGPSQPSAKL
jgi:glycosyltransferase involved in cell wall biosynthesis